MKKLLNILLVISILAIGVGVAIHFFASPPKATQQVVSTAQTQIDKDKTSIASINTAADTKVAALERRRGTPVTARSLARDIGDYVPNLPVAPTVESHNVSDGDGVGGSATIPGTLPPTKSLADAPTAHPSDDGSLVFASADVPALRDYFLTCKENSIRLEACTQTSKLKDDQIQQTETQRDAYKKDDHPHLHILSRIFRPTTDKAIGIIIGFGAGIAIHEATK